jgi:hypothetical protein
MAMTVATKMCYVVMGEEFEIWVVKSGIAPEAAFVDCV